MSDPVERVAQALYMMGVFDSRPKADRAIDEYKRWLAEQGIALDKLLSGEMVAVDARTAERGKKVDEAVIALNIAVDKAERAEAQADYAVGPQVVTPEAAARDQAPSHGRKRPGQRRKAP